MVARWCLAAKLSESVRERLWRRGAGETGENSSAVPLAAGLPGLLSLPLQATTVDVVWWWRTAGQGGVRRIVLVAAA